MRAIDNVRRDLKSASYLQWSTEPFAGAIHDFRKPLAKRLADRQYTGPYYWKPAAPGKGRGFYQSSNGLCCDRAGSTFDLRLVFANDILRGTGRSRILGYYCDNSETDTLQPIVARLPHGRGFLAGWTMGAGMCATLEADIYEDEETAAYAAHSIAARDAERNREDKPRNLEGARRAAVWPEATDAELCQEPAELRAALEARLPALIAAFRADMEAAGFLWQPPIGC